MSVIMFSVGRSGSGKSTAIRHIKLLAESKKCSTTYISDYQILLDMSKQAEYREKFCLNQYNGFDILDFSVMNIALEELERRVAVLNDSQEYDVILVEFARDAYSESFHMLQSASLLKNAYVLFIEAELDTCIKRIYERVFKYQGPDCHFLSENIMTTYFRKDNLLYMSNEFERQFDIQKHHLKVVYNQGSVEALEMEVEDIARHIFQDVPPQQKKVVEIKKAQIVNLPIEVKPEIFADTGHIQLVF